jgi:uncharacterized protein (DUF2235 family)
MTRRIAFFADGTWNRMEPDGGTNVAKLFNATTKGPDQITGYDEGVGNGMLDKFAGGAFGVGISQNIKDGYEFLLHNWQSRADDIFLFGFSRGAYTVRSLGGLIGFIGFIDSVDPKVIDEAYELYRLKPKIDGKKQPPEAKALARYEEFRRKHVPEGRREVPIHFVGVWDTVGALGIPQNLLNQLFNPFQDGFHDTSLGHLVRRAVHAVAIDEKRKAFAPTLWDDDPRVTQVWFAGVHSDVGGGYNDTPAGRKLGAITLLWMAQHAAAAGLRLDPSQLPQVDPEACFGDQHESWTAAWRVVRRFDREIVPGTRLHASVRQRLGETARKFNVMPYVPPKLTKPWERFTFGDHTS